MSIAGLLDMFSDMPEMKYAGCRQRGMAQLFDGASAGDPDQIERAQVVCRLCPERQVCAGWAATLSKSELQRMGVVAGVSYVQVKHPPGRRPQTAVPTGQDGPGLTESAQVAS
jgi:hypothetical protein